jgi:hypothetical protein
MFQLMKLRSAPFEKGNTDYLMSYLGNLQRMSRTTGDFKMNVMSAFRLSPKMAEDLVNGFIKVGGSLSKFTQFESKFKNKLPDEKVEDKISPLIRNVAEITSFFQKSGSAAVSDLDKIYKKLDLLLTKQGGNFQMTPSGVMPTVQGEVNLALLAVKAGKIYDKIDRWLADHSSDRFDPINGTFK